jgi:hypothetical protein
MAIQCKGILGHACCSRAKPANARRSTLDGVWICDSCARAWLKYVRELKANERGVTPEEVRVRTCRDISPYIDIEVLEGGKWRPVTAAPFARALARAIPIG